MRERPDAVGGTSEPETEGRKRIDLNVSQVAGGALAAVLAAELASYFGVYGTILGAGVVSVVATCGGTLFQHFFKRTGEQIRGATAVASEPAARSTEQAPPAPGEFTEGTVYRARARGWKRPVLAAAVVFGVTMAGITTYELASGHNLSGGHSTTVGDVFTGSGKSSRDSGGSDGSDDSGSAGDSGGSGSHGDGDATTSGPPGTGTPEGENASPSPDEDGGTATGPAPSPSTEGSEGPGHTTPSASPTPPEPSASSRSGTADQGRVGPATP
ncbi:MULTISPECIES: hypothetical protein [Streptomyces]|uniref:Uncharacterized protein n=1 Tax=Streptomyces chartreusis NRRL 3882 TaxID=1079985 RepID=A0A2N9B5C2_STRCX|nr:MULTISPECIES: hypothetical protein [Streptomyces]MYS89930.1 hypothetical protein [Streptomyces sp. SID5464]SOR78546.1 hypothetical protein SCNRRL3882_2013 [Streptomyces chartreusis NRRL 3882]